MVFIPSMDHIVLVTARHKIVLKGAPGVDKSSFMKIITEDLTAQQIDVE